MKVPDIEEINFSPLLWREFFVRDSDWKSIIELYPYIKERAQEIDYCDEIKVNVRNTRIKKLIYGYALIDLLKWDLKNNFMLRFKRWELFEDLTAEIFREAIKEQSDLTVVRVDKIIKGLDFVIANKKSDNGWNVGIQCKRYIESELPKCRINTVNSYRRNTSSVNLINKGEELKRRFPKRKFVLICFNSFRNNLTQQKRFNELTKHWDSVVVIDKSVCGDTPYTYKISIPEISEIIKWC